MAQETRNNRKRESLLCEDFFDNGIKINANRVYPMLVMGTMSSGKSTLINALVGQEILPSSNKACTSKMYSILDDDQCTDTSIYITYTDGKTIIKTENVADELMNANDDPAVSQVLIKGQVKGVLNTERALLIVDTPGPNNALNESHETIMQTIMSRINGGLILYVINATQFGINDDKKLLKVLGEYISSKKHIKVIFAINKIDQVDKEKESIENLVLDIYQYIKECGFDYPTIVPVSGMTSLVFKKVLGGQELTRSEYRFFEKYYDIFQPKDFNLKAYAICGTIPNQYGTVDVRNQPYKTRELVRIIENSGISVLEDEIQKAQILSGAKIQNKVRVKKGESK